MDKIEFFRHNLTDEDIGLACDVMRSIFLTTGPKVHEFEKQFSSFLNIKHTIGLTSCTGALHLCLLRHGIGPGDEVITTPMTFVATATAIIETGAKPVFVDVNPKNGLLEPESVEQAITCNTRAILPVHLYGRMVDMKKFNMLAKRNNLILIEDAAHCIEGNRDGVKPGQLSHGACFSFYATKNMTCGEGELSFVNPRTMQNGIMQPATTASQKMLLQDIAKKFQHWDMEMMGWKYNMNDIQAALLIGQINKLEDTRQRRQELETLYREILTDTEEIEFLELPGKNEQSAHHLLTILLPDEIKRDSMINHLSESGIGCAVNYRAVHTLQYFKETFNYAKEDFPIAYGLGSRTLSLPLYPKLKEQQVEQVCKQLIKGINK